MKYSYGIMDDHRIILYKPQLFIKAHDLLVFPSKDFHKWHGDFKVYIDGLYQINSINTEKVKSINITELNLATGLLSNITDELEHLFDAKRVSDFSYQYVSTLICPWINFLPYVDNDYQMRSSYPLLGQSYIRDRLFLSFSFHHHLTDPF